MRSTSLLVCGALLFGALSTAQADDRRSNNACPVGLVSGLTLDAEFGPGAGELTRCLERRHNVKMVMQVNLQCAQVTNGVCTRAYGLDNLQNMFDDYQVTHGMVPGRDFEMAAIMHGTGGLLLIKDEVLKARGKGSNPFEAKVRELMAKGIKFYFCQNTARSYLKNGTLVQGLVTQDIIEGVEFVTGGLTALAEFQARGWQYIQP